MTELKALPKGKLQLIVWENGSVEMMDMRTLENIKTWDSPSKMMRMKIQSLTYRDDFHTTAVFGRHGMVVFITRKSYNR